MASEKYPRPRETTPQLAVLERFMPWMAKKHIARGFVSLANLATYAGITEKLPSERATLWRAIVWMAEDICHQLFVENPHPSLDFGLKQQWRRLAMAESVYVYYWVVLYLLARFRKAGAPHFDAEAEFQALAGVAFRWVHQLAEQLKFQAPQPWSDTWAAEDSARSALSLYQAVYYCLHLPPEPHAELGMGLARAANFTAVTEGTYMYLLPSYIEKGLQGGSERSG